MAKQLKVFRAHLGFYDTIVAAPSQKAALEAWGMHINVFADGTAAVTTDKDAVEAGTAHPGAVLKRPFGSKGAFKLDPDRVPAPLLKAEASAHRANIKREQAKKDAKAERRAREAARQDAKVATLARRQSEQATRRAREAAKRDAKAAALARRKEEQAETASRRARQAAEREIAAARAARLKALAAIDQQEETLRRKRLKIEREAEARIRKAEEKAGT
jgi:hypothetical protein